MGNYHMENFRLSLCAPVESQFLATGFKGFTFRDLPSFCGRILGAHPWGPSLKLQKQFRI